MIWGVSALAWALAAYFAVTRHALPTRWRPDPGRDRPRRRAARAARWTVTDRARAFVGWSPQRLRTLTGAWAIGVGVGWLLLLQSLPAAAVMAWVGSQVPAWWVERRAAQGLRRLHRQFAEFVSLVHDQLHSQGATVETALQVAAAHFTDGPLAPALRAYQAAAGGGAPLWARLEALRAAINLPTADFFFELLRLRDQTGADDIRHAFDALAAKLQDDEQVQSMIAGEVRTHALILVLGFGANLVALPLYRFNPQTWPVVHTHLPILVAGSAVVTAFVFHGLRRFQRAGLEAGALG